MFGVVQGGVVRSKEEWCSVVWAGVWTEQDKGAGGSQEPGIPRICSSQLDWE